MGWGFVVRGNRPCHIQAVEPCGPAAAAGMKVGIMGSVVLAGFVREVVFHLPLQFKAIQCHVTGGSQVIAFGGGLLLHRNNSQNVLL